MPLSLSQPTSPITNTKRIMPHHASLHRPSNSLSAATSSAATRAIANPGLTTSRIAVPASTRTKLVPKRAARMDAPELVIPAEPESSVGAHRCETDSKAPTRRRLQAIFSSESSPSLGDSTSNQPGLENHKPSDAQRARSLRIPYFKGSGQDSARNQETKRTTFTSKLDSIILTSKLFPLPSSRAKAPLTSVSPEQRAATSHTAVIPLAHATASSAPRKGTVLLDSPPSKGVKVQVPRKGHDLLSQSLGFEENRQSGSNAKITDQKVVPKRPGRVSFSERLFSSSTDRGGEPETNVEHTKGTWGSWSGRRGRPAPLSLIKEKSISSLPSTPHSPFSSLFSKSQGEQSGDSDVRRGKRASLAPGCLRTLVSGSSDRNKPPVEGQHDRPVLLRRTHSETCRSGVESRSQSSHYSAPRPRRPEDADQSVKSKDDKKRITLSRVGSPMPQGRLTESQGGSELERSSSVKTAGKLDHRARGVSTELTRRRTIHPMFSFERPGSIEAASVSSSRRGEKADDEEMHERRKAADKSQRLPRKAASPASEPASLPPHDFDAPQSPTYTQDPSHASGHSGGTAPLTRPDPGPTDRIPMMRTRLGMQTHGTFAFEPAAAVVCSPRFAPSVGADRVRGVNPAEGSLTRPAKGANLVRSLSVSDGHAKCQTGSFRQKDRAADKKTKELEYLEFYNEMKFVLGDGEDWSSFKKCEYDSLTYDLIPISSSM